MATAANGLPASFTLTARLQLDAADRKVFIWVEDPTNYNLVLGVYVSGTAPDASPPWDGGYYGIYGPSTAFVEALGGFEEGEDIEVTLDLDAETGEVTGRFEQGERVETLSDEDAQDPWYEPSGDWGIWVGGRSTPTRWTKGPSAPSTI